MVVRLVLLACSTVAVYSSQLAATNAYTGYLPIAPTAGYAVTLIASLLPLGGLVSGVIRKPSDVFGLVYALFVVLPYVVFHSVTGAITAVEYAARYALLLLPLLLVRGISSAIPALRPARLLSLSTLTNVLIWASLIVTTAAIATGPSSAGFAFDAAYERRVDSREVFAAGSLIAYAASIVYNGLLPAMAFLSAVMGRRSLIAISCALAFAYFYLMGLKAPIAYVGFAWLVGRAMAGTGGGTYFHRVLFRGAAGLFAIFVAERIVLGQSWVAEIGYRRVFVVPADIINKFFDMMSSPGGSWSALAGAHAPQGVTFLVGEDFFGAVGMNANTNAFIHALGAGGVSGYAAAVLLVTGVFACFDAMFKGSGNVAFIFLGFLYSILLVEQSATTALASSGVAVLAILCSLLTDRDGDRTDVPAVSTGEKHPAGSEG